MAGALVMIKQTKFFYIIFIIISIFFLCLKLAIIKAHLSRDNIFRDSGT